MINFPIGRVYNIFYVTDAVKAEHGNYLNIKAR